MVIETRKKNPITSTEPPELPELPENDFEEENKVLRQQLHELRMKDDMFFRNQVISLLALIYESVKQPEE